jgi:hypothetical protein
VLVGQLAVHFLAAFGAQLIRMADLDECDLGPGIEPGV